MKSKVKIFFSILCFCSVVIASSEIFSSLATAQEMSRCLRGDLNRLCVSSTEAEEAFRRGRELDLRNEIENAIAEYSRALKLDPSYAEAYMRRSVLLGLRRQVKKAIQDVRKAAEIYNSRGDSFMAGAMQQQEQMLQRAIERGEMTDESTP